VGTTRIFAEYRLNTIHQAIDTVEIEILPLRAIGFITASLQKQNVVANGADSTQIYITVQDSTGGLIADGTSIFKSDPDHDHRWASLIGIEGPGQYSWIAKYRFRLYLG
jgi:hypothetical protein